MEKITFEQFLANENIHVSFVDFIINIIITVILSQILASIYNKYSKSFSDRTITSSNFVYVATTTMVIITIIKSSLALSLGLVGALSIVRFRTAIKDPEELSYLFLSIAIGLGMGANQRYIVITGFLIIVSVIILKSIRKVKLSNYNMFLSIKSNDVEKFKLEIITNILNKYCERVDIKNYDTNPHNIEVLYLINCKNEITFNLVRENLIKVDKNIEISFSDININI